MRRASPHVVEARASVVRAADGVFYFWGHSYEVLDEAGILPYYFYMCDMIPFSEHWRVSVADAQRLQAAKVVWQDGTSLPFLGEIDPAEVDLVFITCVSM